MKRSKNRIKIIGSGFIVLGIFLAAIGLIAGTKFAIIHTSDGFKAIGESDRLKEEFSLNEFKLINIDLTDADVEVIPSTEYKLEIERMEITEIAHTVENDVLSISDTSKSWFRFSMNLGVFIDKTTVKLYIPEDAELVDATISSDFGSIQIEGIAAEHWNVQSTDGDVVISDIQSNSLIVENKFGDLTASNVNTQELKVEMSDGTADLESIDAMNTSVNNLYGDTYYKNFTSHGAKLESVDGDIGIHGVLLGETIIESKFGSVNLQLENKESELSYTIESTFGEVSVNDSEFNSKASQSVETDNKLEVSSTDGDIDVIFKGN
ncbi:DUF4097 family beta strand repeat protein [Ornithinibacillus massiliensis]|uniref:DUF4097 family beta strand repeat protein n=1 Tax=Ornithinibacillus massiliensis TaxID=1944633 RepID=A0ABS5M9X2_9BACI|nr:DUF4097 family beta strand repeat-containing protein [Ornithinibacillus massiliensis]MBS3678737.1 DUF4097 family beta strand repeat protein [Ornithinibacillus massiliensis]